MDTNYSKRLKIGLIGGTTASRAQVCFRFSNAATHVEPFASLCELRDHNLDTIDAFLVLEDPTMLQSLLLTIDCCEAWSPAILIRQNLTAAEVASVLETGGAAVLDLECSPAKMRATIEDAIARWETVRSLQIRVCEAKRLLLRLSSREKQVIELVADGLSNKEIAQQLGISPRTVEIHRAAAIMRLGVECTASAVRLVIEANLQSLLRQTVPIKLRAA